jgi:hypothetical protein
LLSQYLKDQSEFTTNMETLASLLIKHTQSALAQYMVTATAEEPIENNCLFSDVSASIDLVDSANNIMILVYLLFPYDLAANIYESIFGEVAPEELGEVTKEMVNIIGGNIKPELPKYSAEIFSQIHPEKQLPQTDTEFLKFNLGFPQYLMKDAQELKMPKTTAFDLVIPFVIGDEEITLVVAFCLP